MTNLTGSANFVKYLLFLINFLLVLTGIIILSVGATVQGVYHGFHFFLDGQYLSIPSLLIAIGVIIFIVSFFGCCGAYKENYCMVLTFAVFMIVVFILELSAGIGGYVLRNEARSMLANNLRHEMDYYNEKQYEYITLLWDKIQRDFSCCGVDGPKDWQHGLPMSCCAVQTGVVDKAECIIDDTDVANQPFSEGCLFTFSNFIAAHAVSLGAAGVALALIQLVGVFMTCYVAKKIRLTHAHSTF